MSSYAALIVKVPKGRRKYVHEIYLTPFLVSNTSVMTFISSEIFSLNWMSFSSEASFNEALHSEITQRKLTPPRQYYFVIKALQIKYLS